VHLGVCNEGIPGSTAPLLRHRFTAEPKFPDYKPSELVCVKKTRRQFYIVKTTRNSALPLIIRA